MRQDARSKDIEDVLILSGDHLYRMDYMDFVQVRQTLSLVSFCTSEGHLTNKISVNLQNHRQSGADITLSSLPMDDR